MAKAVQTAHKRVTAVENFAFACSDRVFRFGLSVGVVALSAHHVDPKSVLAETDAACYRVKKRGGHDVSVAGTETIDHQSTCHDGIERSRPMLRGHPADVSNSETQDPGDKPPVFVPRSQPCAKTPTASGSAGV